MRDGWANFFLGLGIGVGVGLLIAPKSGEETRSLLKNKADEGLDFLSKQANESGEYLKKQAQAGTDYVKKQTADLRGSATNIVDRGREVLTRQKDVLSDAIEAGKQAYRDKVEQPNSAGTPA